MLELWLRVRGLEFKGSVAKLPNETRPSLRHVLTEASSGNSTTQHGGHDYDKQRDTNTQMHSPHWQKPLCQCCQRLQDPKLVRLRFRCHTQGQAPSTS